MIEPRFSLLVFSPQGKAIALCDRPGDALELARRNGLGTELNHADIGVVWREDFETFAMDAFARLALLTSTLDEARRAAA